MEWDCRVFPSVVAVLVLPFAPAVAHGFVEAADSDEEESVEEYTDKEINELVGDLFSTDALAREVAVKELIGAGRPVLAKLRKHVDRDLPLATELALERVYSGVVGLLPETVEEINAELDQLRYTEDPAAIRAAARRLVKAGRAEVEYTLAELEHAGYSQLRILADKLQTLSAVSDLAEGVNTDDRAARSLQEMGESVVEHLAEVSADFDLPAHWRKVATERLLFLGGDRAFDTALGLVWRKDRLTQELTVPFVCAMATPDQFAQLARPLMPLMHEEPGLAGHLQGLGDRLESDFLRQHLDNRTVPVAWLAARLLGQRRDENSREPLKALLSHKRAIVVEEAIRALGRIGNADDLFAVRRTLQHEEAFVRRAAVGALGRIDAELAPAWVTAALRDPNASVRAKAATVLGGVGDDAAVGALIETLADREPSVIAAATRSLARLTGKPVATALASSSERELKRVRDSWKRWWSNEAEEKPADEDDEENQEPASQLASEGRRILDQLASSLRRQFRPYGELKGQELTTDEALMQAAVEGMQNVLARQPDDEDPDLLLLKLDNDAQAVLRHFFQHGSFQDAGDLASMVGSMPIPLEGQDYILLVYEAAEAMVDSLGDRFTRLSMIEDAAGKVDKDALPSLFGKGKTLGFFTKETDTGPVIEFIMALSVADRAGLRPGDKIISVNGKLAAEFSKEQLQRRLKKKVTLMVLRDGWTRPVTFELEPEELDPETLVQTAVLPGNLGYLRLQQFDLGCAQQIEWALRDLEKQGIGGLIFDLRRNPGGTVLDAVAIVDKFVPEGENITTTWVNSWNDDEDYDEEIIRSTDSDADRDYPLVVLVSKCSASASEMTSGALQDLERAQIVGRTTWGKGIGQIALAIGGFTRSSVFGESRGTLQLGITILEYFLPSGRSIQGIGVEPDHPVSESRLLGERFELLRRARKHPKMEEFVSALIEQDGQRALALARFDDWDPDEYDGFAELKSDLGLELNDQLIRRAVRSSLRAALAEEHPGFAVVDVQEDEDVRTGVQVLAESLELDLEEFPEYEDLAE